MDFGEDLGVGDSTNFGLAMERDHEERRSWDAYNDDPHHDRVGRYIDSITVVERTARIDFDYRGPSTTRGGIRHVGLYSWREDAGQAAREAAQEEVRRAAASFSTVRAVVVGDDLGWRPGHADWVMESHFDDVDGFAAYRASPVALAVASHLGRLTLPERTAQIQHRMLSG
jgi:hypothetical protein